jgi:glutamyl-tRNA synthetase
MPLLFGTDKKKLSKRHGATKLEQLTAMGYLVEVVRNYLAFLSTEFDESMIAWTLDDLVRQFEVEKLGTSASIFDPEKLRWMNGRFVRQMSPEALAERLIAYLTRVGFYGDPAHVGEVAAAGPQALAAAVEGAETAHAPATAPSAEQERRIRAVAPLVQEKIEVLADFVPIAGWFFRPLALTEEARERLAGTAGAAATLTAAASGLRALSRWDLEAVVARVRALPSRLELKPKAVFATLRLGMSGQGVTPGLFESLWVLGRDEAASRLEHAVALLG